MWRFMLHEIIATGVLMDHDVDVLKIFSVDHSDHCSVIYLTLLVWLHSRMAAPLETRLNFTCV
jgi:hypothetical protein